MNNGVGVRRLVYIMINVILLYYEYNLALQEIMSVNVGPGGPGPADEQVRVRRQPAAVA